MRIKKTLADVLMEYSELTEISREEFDALSGKKKFLYRTCPGDIKTYQKGNIVTKGWLAIMSDKGLTGKKWTRPSILACLWREVEKRPANPVNQALAAKIVGA